MKYMHSEWQRRLDHWLKTLKDDLYLPLGEMETEGFLTMEQLSPDEALKGPFTPMKKGTKWGRTWEYCWLRGKITLPAEAQGKRIVIDLKTGGEATVFVDGRSFGTYRAGWVKEPHHFLVDNFLTGCGEAGRSYDILLEAYAGHFFPQSPLGGCATGPVLPGSYQDPKKEGERREFKGITYGIWNEDAYQLYMDLDTLRQLGDQIVPESLRADKVAQALEEATIAIDFEQPLEGRIASYREARQILKGALEAKNGSTMPKFYAIGNAHLDLAWLWPMAETYRKTSRTFAAQLRLLDEYPDYRYLQSQPAAYEMCREYYPELFERIREAAKEGRWIPEGAMWVEPDTNMTSGESLVRQVLHGKRYFRDVFGVDSLILWLPDSFGYSAALPQILKKTGVKYLVTQKIFWSYNEGDQFPYHYFTWKGADGSSIDTFLPTSYTYRTDPQEICETWKGRVQKRGLDAFLLPFGYGDGGGGPTRDHIEYLEREKDLEGMPRMVCESPVKFFEDMEAEGGPKHTYVGELYFSAHRGVFTSQADIKKGNRKSELALREAEIWGAAASAKKNYQYPLEKMDAAWKKLLLNQFHDILPGSSIARVYEDARADHRWIISQAEEVKEEAFRALTEGEGVTVFNSLSFERTGLVDLPAEYAGGAEAADGTVFRTMEKDGAVKALVTVPACGSISLKPAAGKAEEKDCAAARAYVSENGIVIENEKVRALIDGRGELVSFVLKESGREFAAGPMNHLLMYKDVPRLFDAWDIDSNYILQELKLDEPVSVEITCAEGLQAVVHTERRISESVFSQDIVLEEGSRRLEFRTHVDWRELHRLLKVEFPAAVEATEGINEIQFGYMKRPTHRSRLYDSDRFEVCAQRYSALCDENHGAAVLNDCKYGISMNGNALQLTLLRAASCPEMRADNGEHDFTYAVTAWEGSFLDSPVVKEAYELNVPLQFASGSCPSIQAFTVDAPNVFIDTVKLAEDGSGDVIVRLYEAKKADTFCRFTSGIGAKKIWSCDMLENKEEELELKDGTAALHFHTFEVKTLRISR